MLLAMIQMIDGLFTKIIFLPMLYILYCRFTGVRKRGATAQKIYRYKVIIKNVQKVWNKNVQML